MANTVTLSDSPRGLRAAAGLLERGELVAFPTETVYGLGADARDDRAVARIYTAKGRPSFNPLIVHVVDLAAAERLATFTPEARSLAERFWPGPLTLVLRRRPDSGLADATTAGLPTVALRVPVHPLARRLIEAFAGPLAAPSANRSGAISPTTAAHVRDSLAGRIAAILDGGSCPVGLESTILGFDGGDPVMLRPGGLAVEAIVAHVGRPVTFPDAAASITAPGQLASHYAPRAVLRLDAAAALAGEIFVGFGPDDPAELNLSPNGDLAEAAANLFAHLRAADTLAARVAAGIAVAPIPRHGLGAAINDRLARASAPR